MINISIYRQSVYWVLQIITDDVATNATQHGDIYRVLQVKNTVNLDQISNLEIPLGKTNCP